LRNPQALLCLAVLLAAGSTGCHPSGASGAGPAGDSTGDASVLIDPPAAEASPGATLQFAATAVGSPVAIEWSIAETNGGSIDGNGVYTAPTTEGTFHVVASAVSGAAQQTATVTVRHPGSTTTPPSDGTTRWAPAASDTSWVSVTAFGAVGNGVADDTSAFRNAAATGKKLFVPGPPVAYKLTGVVRVQNSVYGDGSMPEIRMYGADGDPDQGTTHNMFYVSGYQGGGLVFNGLHLNGQWDGVGSNGEWSHGININASSNVTVQNCTIERAYGDDVFIASFSSTPSRNVVVQNNTLRDPRRCNVAVNHATGVTIKGNAVVKTGSYVSAIDLEPDPLGFQYVRGVTIDGNSFDVVAQGYGAGAISLNSPAGNPSSGDVAITNNHGSWVPTYAYMDVVPGSNGLVGIVPHLSWYNVTASNDTH
jgi:hypothetical protein